jgi:hypothetical protein
MQPQNDDTPGTAPALGSRWPELLVAGALMIIGAMVIADAQRVGTGWDEFDGPRSGYFPFYIGCLLLGASSWTALRTLLRWKRENPAFVERAQLASVWSITWPMTLYVVAIGFIGIYVASALLIGFFMLRHGQWRRPVVALVAGGVPLSLFMVFERWFLVALPKGPIEALLGF